MIVGERAQVQAEGSGQGERRMDIGGYLQRGIQILQLDEHAVREAEKDEDALLPAMGFFAIAGLASGVAQFSFRGMLIGAVLATILSVVLVGILHVLSRLFGASSSFLELYRPLGLSAPIHWVQVVPVLGPFLGFLAAVYSLVVAAKVLESAAGLPRTKAVIVVALLFGISLFLCLIFLAYVGSLLLIQSIFS